jgi:hypothetical protein
LIALMQTATTLPVFLVGFPAWALADIVNRRRLLLATQGHIEAFMAESWVDYLRQLERMTNADHATEDHARSFHLGSVPPTVTPLIAEHPNWHDTPDRMG